MGDVGQLVSSAFRRAVWDDGRESIGLETTDEPMDVPESFLWSVAVTPASRVSVSVDDASSLVLLLSIWAKGVTKMSLLLSTEGGVIRAVAGNGSGPVCIISAAGVAGESEPGELEDEGEDTEAEEEEG